MLSGQGRTAGGPAAAVGGAEQVEWRRLGERVGAAGRDQRRQRARQRPAGLQQLLQAAGRGQQTTGGRACGRDVTELICLVSAGSTTWGSPQAEQSVRGAGLPGSNISKRVTCSTPSWMLTFPNAAAAGTHHAMLRTCFRLHCSTAADRAFAADAIGGHH